MNWLGRKMARATLLCLGFWPGCVTVRSRPDLSRHCGPALVCANHVSWLDVLVFMAEPYSPSFVAKVGSAQGF